MPKKIRRFDTRKTMNGDTYEVFHYLDMKTHSLDSHYHDFYEIFCFVDGDVDYWVEGSLYHLKSGDVLLINPSELHKPVPRAETQKYERIVIWIDKKYLSGIDGGIFERCFDTENPSYKKILRLSSDEKNQVLTLAHKFVGEFYSEEFGSKSCAYGILLEFMTLINRIALCGDVAYSEKYRTPTFVAEIISYIGEHYSEKLSLDKLADHFFINKYYLSHEFKKAVGTSVYRYITLKRLSIAHNLLGDGVPPSQVSVMCGFGDYTNFFRAFKTEYGISPAECCGGHTKRI